MKTASGKGIAEYEEHKMIEALQACLECMEIQERRESEEFFISQEAFWPLWERAKKLAREVLTPNCEVVDHYTKLEE